MSQKKQAFVLCARGDRFVRYRNNLAKSIEKYVPEADIVDIDAEKAESILPHVSERRRSIQMTRLAIPLMDEFRRYDRVIWLDVDTDIVSGKFAGILSVDTSKDGLAAVEDINQEKYRIRMEERYPGYDKASYVNSGVLVMDLLKIDKDVWRKKVTEGIEEHARNPFKSPDQDLINRYFDINIIDKRYNWIWRRGADADVRAWLVHYTDGGGHAMLDEIISIRNGERQGMKRSKERMVATCPRHELVKPWIRAYFANGNTIPLAIVEPSDGSWTEDDRNYCKKAAEFSGGTVLNASKKHASKNLVISYIAKKLAPLSWAWIDDSAEVTGCIDECFDYAEKRPGFICAQFYSNGKFYHESIDSRHPSELYLKPGKGGKICWTSFMIFHGEANERLSKDMSEELPALGDDAFGYLYQTDESWHEGFCDMSFMNWQENFSKESESPESWSGKILNFVPEDAGKSAFRLASLSDTFPPAPFEDSVKISSSSDDDKDGPVDAVFVIGTGSADNNEELRYALRNIERNCPFVRNVYISGFCPEWVDRSKVIHLNWPDRFKHAKDANIIDKLRHACEHRGIAKKILFCSDDQFQTRVCSWNDFRPRYLRRYASNDRWYEDKKRVWHSRLRNTLERDVERRRSIGIDANDVYYYQPHIWMAIDRDRFVEYAKWSNYEKRTDTIIASGYYNFINADGEPDFDHVFLSSSDSKIPNVTHVAYHDGSEKAAMKILKSMFPSKSRFELEGRTNERNTERKIKRRQDPNPPVNVDKPKDIQSTKADDDPSGATAEEMSEILEVTSKARDTSSWNGLLGEISRAEELRLFGVRGWRTVWRDIARRWRSDTRDGKDKSAVTSKRSDEASKVIERYMSDPDGMRTVRFGPKGHGLSRATPSFGRQMPRKAPDEVVSTLRDRIRSSLRDRIKN